MPKDKGYPRPAGGGGKGGGKGQCFQNPTTKNQDGLGKNFRVKRNPSS